MLQPGTRLSQRYVIESLVGRGGMGAVYHAHDERLGREVAIKLLRADLAADPAARTRFLREGQIAAQIVHPNVVRTYDAGDDPVGPYLVQEFLTGQTLDHVLPLPPARAAALIRDIAAALDAIHSRGYVHCDIKPQNILIKQNGVAVLLDFGIARAEGADTTTLIATPHYLAPERALGTPPAAASDLYALGIVLFQAAAGYPPFDAPAVHAIIQQHINVPVPALPGEAPAARVLDQIIARLAAKRPEDRYPSAAAVEADLAAVQTNAVHAQPTVAITSPRPAVATPLESGVSAMQPPPRDQTPRPAPRMRPDAALQAWSAAPAWRRRRWLAAVLIPLLLLLLGFGIARARRAPDQTLVPEAGAAAPGTPVASTPAALAATATRPVATATQGSDAVAVAPVVDLQFEAARQVLAEQGFEAVPGEARQDERAAGIVLESEPPAGTSLASGSPVVLHVSSGPAAELLPPVEAPPVVEELGDAEDDDKEEDKDKGKGNGKGKGKGKKDD